MADNPLAVLIRNEVMRRNHQALITRYIHLSTDGLKAMWDRCAEDHPYVEGEPDVDDLYALLNARGEGSYCAV